MTPIRLKMCNRVVRSLGHEHRITINFFKKCDDKSYPEEKLVEYYEHLKKLGLVEEDLRVLRRRRI